MLLAKTAYLLLDSPLLTSQETKALLEKAEDPDCRASLLRFIAAFSGAMSPRGLDTDVRHILVLVLLVGRLDDPDSMLRCTAAQLLICEHHPLPNLLNLASCRECTALCFDHHSRCTHTGHEIPG